MTHRIAILSDCRLARTHLDRMRALGDVTEYAKTLGENEAIKRLEGVNIAVADGSDIEFTSRIFECSPSLAYLCLNSTGYDQVDLEAARSHGVIVGHVPAYSTDSVAEHVFALLFSLIRHIPKANWAMHGTPFEIDLASREHDQYLSRNVRGKILGVIGVGPIGARVAELGVALGLKVRACSARDAHSGPLAPGVDQSDLNTVLRHSDIISINEAYRKALKHFFDIKTLAILKRSAVIINTARGGFMDEAALAVALSSQRLAGYAADVLDNMSPENPLLPLPNVVLTPHMAFFSEESLERLADSIVANVESFVAGYLVNQVRGDAH